jgi:hypothetical protein
LSPFFEKKKNALGTSTLSVRGASAFLCPVLGACTRVEKGGAFDQPRGGGQSGGWHGTRYVFLSSRAMMMMMMRRYIPFYPSCVFVSSAR